ncbi:Alpha-N-acetylgalactosaminidase [Stylophora pistillata]|uniref:Alpha-galactosidase n=1 Tax=Stylophora pistillata TaxID=50429 RepID=A0A2B4RMF4_STYPI|nr:Alpha-N-acetylgalactosaminidase [Stylophora pistillata]
MAWERFRCNIDCDDDPQNCVSEKLFMQMADRIAEDGFQKAGYKYVCIDDCWASYNRTLEGDLQPDPTRFPSGIKKLADYIHSKGLKFGLYADYGHLTCERYPGSIDYIQQDMQLFADWGVDYLKMDGCFADPLTFDEGYPTVTRALNETGRHIVFSCSWPAYQVWGGMTDSWLSMVRIVEWYGDHQHEMIPVAGPGQWNDPDQPLMMSNDLRDIAPWAREILLNMEVIDVNQDKLGKMGRRVTQSPRRFTEVWCRPLHDGSVAVVLSSRRADQPIHIEAFFHEVGLPTIMAKARDLFEHKDLGTFKKSFRAKVNPSGVVMVKLSPIHYEL